MKIQKFNENEDRHLKALETLAEDWSLDFWTQEEVLKSLRQGEHTHFYLLDVGGSFVGAILFSIVVGGSELLYLYVSPSSRGQGASREMMRHYLSFAEVKGVSEFFLEVRESNGSARNLYESLGYEIFDQRKSYYKNGDTALMMKRESSELP